MADSGVDRKGISRTTNLQDRPVTLFLRHFGKRKKKVEYHVAEFWTIVVAKGGGHNKIFFNDKKKTFGNFRRLGGRSIACAHSARLLKLVFPSNSLFSFYFLGCCSKSGKWLFCDFSTRGALFKMAVIVASRRDVEGYGGSLVV